MLIVTADFSATARPDLLVRLEQLLVELVEVRDQFVDALVRILASLIGGQQRAVEFSHATMRLGEVAAKSSVLLLQSVVRFDQRRDSGLEPVEIVLRRGVLRVARLRGYARN